MFIGLLPNGAKNTLWRQIPLTEILWLFIKHDATGPKDASILVSCRIEIRRPATQSPHIKFVLTACLRV